MTNVCNTRELALAKTSCVIAIECNHSCVSWFEIRRTNLRSKSKKSGGSVNTGRGTGEGCARVIGATTHAFGASRRIRFFGDSNSTVAQCLGCPTCIWEVTGLTHVEDSEFSS